MNNRSREHLDEPLFPPTRDLDTRADIAHEGARQERLDAFRWHSRDGDLPLNVMTTQHLFYSLRMIWHHYTDYPPVAPAFNRYQFNEAVYTDAYLTQAIRYLAQELSTRTDLAPYLQRQLQLMQIHTQREGMRAFVPLMYIPLIENEESSNESN